MPRRPKAGTKKDGRITIGSSKFYKCKENSDSEILIKHVANRKTYTISCSHCRTEINITLKPHQDLKFDLVEYQYSNDGFLCLVQK